MNRQHCFSGTPWEDSFGYSRAVRTGNQIFVSGTTASAKDGSTVAVRDAGGQARFALGKIEAALSELGASLSDVVRTRIFVVNIDQWEEIGHVHIEFFGNVRPAATLVEVSRLINPDHLVEIEVDAVVSSQVGG